MLKRLHGPLAALVLLLGATNALGEADKGQRIKKLQRANRAYQVCLGRSLKPAESGKVLGQPLEGLVRELASGNEAKLVFADRLATFEEGGETKEKLPINAKLDAKLEDTLKLVGGSHHKGKLCGQAESNASCFAKWLVGRVAPTLGESWVTERQNVLNGWTYTRLLEEISSSSLKED